VGFLSLGRNSKVCRKSPSPREEFLCLAQKQTVWLFGRNGSGSGWGIDFSALAAVNSDRNVYGQSAAIRGDVRG